VAAVAAVSGTWIPHHTANRKRADTLQPKLKETYAKLAVPNGGHWTVIDQDDANVTGAKFLKNRSYENKAGLLGFVHQSGEFFAGSYGNSNRMTQVPSIGFSCGCPAEQPPYVGFTINIPRAESKFTFSVEKGEQGENQQRNDKSDKAKKSGKGKQADTDDKPANLNSPHKVEYRFRKGDFQLSYRDDESHSPFPEL
jgi:hypothetical protein